MNFKNDNHWVIVNPVTGSRRYVTYKEAVAYLKKHPEYTYQWMGSVCMLVIMSKGVK